MTQKNQWIFTLATLKVIVCLWKKDTLAIQGSRTIEVVPDSLFKDKTATTHGHYENKTTILTSYPRLKALDYIRVTLNLLK